ncbi:hypothetical protein EVAR_83294_1 [Eumeta japonica]|uniref:Uncharacterized protein n=1 Tax=Eumeta variegata TaxID=151549 RepID=A0A4C2A3V3_EUMVA|nr:hypothetical protein EVAR_83294_1 [Eumeta japonica]
MSMGISCSTSYRAVSFFSGFVFVLATRDEIRKELPLSFLLVLFEGKLPSKRARSPTVPRGARRVGGLHCEVTPIREWVTTGTNMFMWFSAKPYALSASLN